MRSGSPALARELLHLPDKPAGVEKARNLEMAQVPYSGRLLRADGRLWRVRRRAGVAGPAAILVVYPWMPTGAKKSLFKFALGCMSSNT